MSQWIVNGEVVSKELNEKNFLEIELIDSGLQIRVWEKAENEFLKPKLMYHKIISHGQLGYCVPQENK